MNFRDYLKNNLVILDGGMGTLLQENGLNPGEHPEMWNISHPDIITEIHTKYFNSGSNVVNTNTFGANPLKFDDVLLEKIICAAVTNAKKAREISTSQKEKYISLDIGPLGRLIKPFGDLEFEDAISAFGKIVSLGVKYGVDLITVETMNDSYETKAAVIAVKENSTLPLIVTNAYGTDEKLITGASPAAMVALLEGLGVDALGANCSLGPAQLMDIADEFLSLSSVPVVIKPNAGLPKVINNETRYDVTADEFSDIVTEMCKKGIRVIGGCCGTTPEYIKLLNNKTAKISPCQITPKNFSCVSSYSHSVFFNNKPILIGERINPTGKKRFKQALIENDIDYILKEGISQQEKGVHILDVNVGLPEIEESAVLKNTITELQAVTNLPLQIDTSDINAMEQAMRVYNGKPMVNSVNGKEECMNSIFPLVKKYGGLVVALTLDEKGIPNNADGRVEIAKKIIKCAETYGISKKDLIFDPLAMTISADTNAANVTLESLNRIKTELNCNTSLGISNVSFGLPCRDNINSAFFSMALSKGLSAAIMNPYSTEMMKVYYSYLALNGNDDNCSDYIKFCSEISTEQTYSSNVSVINSISNTITEPTCSELQKAIIQGRKETAAIITGELLLTSSPMTIVEDEIIPALDTVGKGFENKTVYLPQLLMSAESAKASFEIIKQKVSSKNSVTSKKNTVVIATVKGDIHDIGKNIVKLLLENYGFKVIDLGKDVDPTIISESITKNNAKICCLSALMTTTVPSMEKTINLIRKNSPECNIIVGGAVLNKDYADEIGADFYGKDAMEAVRIASNI